MKRTLPRKGLGGSGMRGEGEDSGRERTLCPVLAASKVLRGGSVLMPGRPRKGGRQGVDGVGLSGEKHTLQGRAGGGWWHTCPGGSLAGTRQWQRDRSNLLGCSGTRREEQGVKAVFRFTGGQAAGVPFSLRKKQTPEKDRV